MDENNQQNYKSRFFAMSCREDVADILGIEDRSLRYFLFRLRPDNMYSCFSINKKSGGRRAISAPDRRLRNIQRKLADILTLVYEPKACVYGFISNQNCIRNAKRHLKPQYVLNIDLKDFFTQIHFGRVSGMLKSPPYSFPNEVAVTIAQIACYKGILPQGAPTSPIISNMICKPLDNALMKLAKTTNSTYTRYADDITFSTYRRKFDESLAVIKNGQVLLSNTIIGIIAKHSFVVNEDKISFRPKTKRQEVTGITVNKFPNLKREYLRLLRIILFRCKKEGLYITAKEYVAKGCCNNPEIARIVSDPHMEQRIVNWFKKVLVGKVHYVRQVRGKTDTYFICYAKQINEIFAENLFKLNQYNALLNIAQNCTFVIMHDRDDDFIQGSGFIVPGYGLFTSNHLTESDKLFDVCRYQEYPDKHVGQISNIVNLITSDHDIDYALYSLNIDSDINTLQIGDSRNLQIGDPIICIGYPKYLKGNSPNISTGNITSMKEHLGEVFYTVNCGIYHGASGGIVLSAENKVIGIIKGGVDSFVEEHENENQGFVPIHLAIEHYNNNIK